VTDSTEVASFRKNSTAMFTVAVAVAVNVVMPDRAAGATAIPAAY
jgi:hypothetical protein